MKLEDSTAYTAGCFRGEPASCSCACPFHLDVRGVPGQGGAKAAGCRLQAAAQRHRLPGDRRARCATSPAGSTASARPSGDEAIAIRDLEAAVPALRQEPQARALRHPAQGAARRGGRRGRVRPGLRAEPGPEEVPGHRVREGGGLGRHPALASPLRRVRRRHRPAVLRRARRSSASAREVASLDELAGFDAVYVATGAGGDSFGLLDSWDAGLFTTSEPKVFMGGALCRRHPHGGHRPGSGGLQGHRGVPADGQGRPRVHAPTTRRLRPLPRRTKASASAPLVEASRPDGYTEEEARAEAARCLQCDCDDCMAACEMLKRFRKDPAQDRRGGLHRHGRQPASVVPHGHQGGLLLQHLRPLHVRMPRGRGRGRAAAVLPRRPHERRRRTRPRCTTSGCGRWTSPPPRAPSLRPRRKRDLRVRLLSRAASWARPNPEHVLRSYEFLAGELRCRHLPRLLRRPGLLGGRRGTAAGRTSSETRRIWEELGRPTLVFACATCDEALRLFPARDPAGLALRVAGAASGHALAPGRRPVRRSGGVRSLRGPRRRATCRPAVRELAGTTGVALDGARGTEPLLRPRRAHQRGQSQPL